jgi:carboxylesterase type B
MSALPSFPLFISTDILSIYGGGFYAGSTSQPGYDPTQLIRLSQSLSQPIIAVSMNYRLGLWGFLSTPETFAEGSTNAGLMDQRLAFRWIRDNIGAFGGDPDRVTVWGVSAGAQSIGLHLHAFGGKGDALFSGAIMESGGPVGTALQPLEWYKGRWEELLILHGCQGAKDRLVCMRGVSEKDLFSKRTKTLWNPIVGMLHILFMIQDLMVMRWDVSARLSISHGKF